MFSGKPRPIPSKGALRVLYQLAYISSGTAVGVATLCAEERRRRTAIVQKISDNAKRLRQSPRHVHNAATAAADEKECWPFAGEWEHDGEDFVMKKAAKTSTLPSEVEKAYEKLDGRKGRMRRKTVKRLDLTEEQDGRHQATKEAHDTAQPRFVSSLSVRKVRSTPDSNDPESLLEQRLRGRQRPDTAHSGGMSAGLSHDTRISESSNLGTQGARTESNKFPLVPPWAAEYEPFLQESSFPRSRDLNTLSRNIDSFLQDAPSAIDQSEPNRVFRLARVLLIDALKLANLQEIKRLVGWALSAGKLAEQTLDLLFQPVARLSRTIDHDDLFDFYLSVFNSDNFRKTPLRFQIWASLKFGVQSTYFELGQLDREARLALILEGPISRAGATDPELFPQELGRKLDNMMANGEFGRAASLIVVFSQVASRYAHVVREEFLMQETDNVCAKALARDDLRSCLSLLQASLDNEWRPIFVQLLETVAKQRSKNRRRTLLNSMLQSVTSDPAAQAKVRLLQSWLPGFGKEERMALAEACINTIAMPLDLFKALYRSLPRELQFSLERNLRRRRLYRLWDSTRNFDLVWKESEIIQDTLRRLGTNPLSNTQGTYMVEVCIQANKLDRAFEMLSRISKDNAHSSLSLAAAAGFLAKKGVWDQIQQLLEILGRSGKRLWDTQVSWSLNNVIRLHSVKHSPSETWSFVADLVDRIGFRPTKRTSFIMLKHLVVSERLDLIPEWVSFLKSRGHHFEMDTGLAVELFWTYYLQVRPAHSLVMWMCRQLVQNVSSFETNPFRDLVREALSFDVRNNICPHLRFKAELNLARLLSSHGVMPEPLHKMDFRAIVQESKLRKTEREDVESIQNIKNEVKSSQDLLSGLVARQNEDGNLEDLMRSWNTDDHAHVDPELIPEDLAPPGERLDGQGTTTGSQDSVSSVSQQDDRSADLEIGQQSADKKAFETPASARTVFQGTKSVKSIKDELRASQESSSKASGSLDEDYKLDNLTRSSHVNDHDQVGPEVVPADITLAHEPENKNFLESANGQVESYQTASNHCIQPAKDTFQDDDDFEPGPVSTTSQRKHLERLMIMALSRRRYQTALSLYHCSLDQSGLPAGKIILETAVEASLREHKGHPIHAKQIMRRAEKAGFNVTGAMGPILLHQMWHLPRADKKDAHKLGTMVIEYYRANEAKGFVVKHQVGLTAANILVNNYRPKEATDLLNAIYKSSWGIERPFDIVAMTIYLKAYATLRAEDGVTWVFQKVLDENMRIDDKFLQTIKFANAEFGRFRTSDGRWTRGAATPFHSRLKAWRVECLGRQFDQRITARNLGWNLVNMITQVANMQDIPESYPVSREEQKGEEDAGGGDAGYTPVGLFDGEEPKAEEGEVAHGTV